ncbi:Flp pilus assembly protein TadD [Sinobacterium caligoides]|uniref:Flp pilus assembly protein TadD n=1 Tax=Sinobacterium caligoides TaxID=933926 RepID=A0A3N2E1Z6_9GAMM|nr:tetratricopeptide repeat protein [Sinobacterium caligoides]ROS06126.1 Flp pilus assembly protein TadD [Sinobacterium caligoides]
MYLKNKFSVASAALCMASVIVLSGCGGREDREEVYVDKAKSYIEEGNFDKALVDVKNVLQINANNIQGRLILAEIEEENKNWQGMYQNLLFVVDKDPENYEANAKLVQVYIAMKKLDEAKLAADILTKVAPERAESYASLSIIALTEGDREKAIVLAEKGLQVDSANLLAVTVLVKANAESPVKALSYITAALQASPASEELYKLKLRVDAQANDIEGVRDDFKNLVSLDKHNIAYYNGYFKSYMSDEVVDFKKVTLILDDAILENPEEPRLKLWRADVIRMNKGYEESAKYIKSVIAEFPEVFVYREALAKLYMTNKEPENAEKVFQSAIDYNPDGASALSSRLKLAKISLAKGEAEKGERYVDETLAIDSVNVDALIIKAKLQLSRSELDRAITGLRSALNVKPDSVEALLILGGVYEFNNDSLLALENYKKAVGYEPNNLSALLKLGLLNNKMGDFEMAEQYLSRVVQDQPKNGSAIGVLADIYSSQERWDDAKSLLQSIENDENYTALRSYVMARILLRENDLKAAEPLLIKSIYSAPGIIEPLTTYIQLMLSTNRVSDAETFINQFIVDNPKAFHAYETRGMIYQIKGENEKAKQSYIKAVELNPAASTSYLRLASMAMVVQDYKAAEAYYMDVVNNSAEPEKGELALAELYRLLERYDDARNMYRQILDTKPNNVIAKNNYAVLLLDYFGDEKDVREARELLIGFEESNVPAFLDTFGWLQYRLGNYTQAVSYLRLAKSRGGEGVEFDYHLGMAYKATEMSDEAKKYLESALADKELQFKGRDTAEQALADL